jgi:hypothetical protein
MIDIPSMTTIDEKANRVRQETESSVSFPRTKAIAAEMMAHAAMTFE